MPGLIMSAPPAGTTQGSPKGVGVPYWPDEGGGGGDPDRLSPLDLPPPLVPLGAFLGGSGRGAGHEAGSEGTIPFEPTSFDHPVFIMFSSGTTGLPKCMVHGAGGMVSAPVHPCFLDYPHSRTL